MMADDNPPGNNLTDRLRGLPPEKRAAVEKLLKDKLASHDDMQSGPQLVAVDREQELPLSFGQQRMWFLYQLDPEASAYNLHMTSVFLCSKEILVRALDTLVERHEILRTTYSMGSDGPLQVIHPHSLVEPPLVDLSEIPDQDVTAEVNRILSARRRLPLDLESGPVWRALLLRFSHGRIGLNMIIHHIATDGWSMKLLFQELQELCRAWSEARVPMLPELPIQYADYSYWQRQWLQGEVLDAQLAYWRQQLKGIPAALELTTDFTRPAAQTYNGAAVKVRLSATLTAVLKALARREQATLFMTLLAIFKILLYRYTGQQDSVVGTPVACRERPEVKNAQGLFLNTLVLRTKLSADASFIDILRSVRKTTLGAFAHQDVPFEKLVEDLQPQRDMSRNPLFQAFFSKPIVQHAARQTGKQVMLDDMEALSEGQAEFDIALWVDEYDDDIDLRFNYNTDLFRTSTIERMAEHYLRLVESITAEPGQAVSELPILRQFERNCLLEEWNRTQQDYPQKTLIGLFERQVARVPESQALMFEEELFSYRELDARANRLAHYLQRLEVAPGVKVAVCLERGIEMVVGVLAVLKAGGAYVPLDPAWPGERLAFMLADSKAPLLLSQASMAEGLPYHAARLVCVERESDVIAAESDTTLDMAPGMDDLAYVIYTSGSTGKPKGVQIAHRALSNFLLSMAAEPGLDEHDVLLAVTTLSFDIAGLEIYLPLVTGARVVLASREMAADGMALSALLQSSGATFMQATPATWRLLLAGGWSGSPKLKVLCGGEAMPRDLADRLLERSAEVWNMYGPTETTIWSTIKRVEAGSSAVLIGRPIANTRIYILDARLEPAPTGVAGELYIGGEGLAQGYWRRPELTAERFIPDPFSDDPAARLYKTGDLVRYQADGDIEYLGRMDSQVKLRGYRIEPGEIEALLERQASVEAAVVVVREETQGDQRLVAYVVAQADAVVSEKRLRDALAAFLPAYMVPSSIVPLHALPLTPGGKIDRKALPAPEGGSLGMPYVAPQTNLERQLAAIWREVLGVRQIGINDNFFSLGGHSLLAMQVISAYEKQTGIHLNPVDFFQNSLQQLASAGESAKAAGSVAGDLPLVAVARSGNALPVSFSQQRLWYLHQLDPHSGAYNLQFVTLLRSDPETLQLALDRVVARHEVLRTTFEMREGELMQLVHPPAPTMIAFIDLGEQTRDYISSELTSLIREQASTSFDLVADPLYQAAAITLPGGILGLVMTLHHIVTDRWSLAILQRELDELCRRHIEGGAPQLPELPVQYGDYSVWQRELLTGDVLERQLEYWRGKLAGIAPAIHLPTDHPRPAIQSYHGSSASLAAGSTLSQSLLAFSRDRQTSLFMTLLAVWKLLLFRYSGQTDIVVGTPVAAREQPEVQQLMGLFLNTLVLRDILSSDMSFDELLDQVRDNLLEALTHQELPFEKVVEAVCPQRDLSRTPLFQHFFNMINIEVQGEEVIDLARELGLQAAGNTEAESKFDLTLYASERNGEIGFNMVYNRDLFEAESIAAMLDQYLLLLQQIVASPGKDLASYTLTTPAMLEWLPDPSRQMEEPDYPVLTEIFRERVRDAADHDAISRGGHCYNYTELSARMESLAAVLLSRGVARGDVVVVSGAPSFGLVAGMLAVFAAGGVLLTLDPGLPLARQRLMLTEAEARFGIQVADGSEAVAEWSEALPLTHVVHIDAESAQTLSLNGVGEWNGRLPVIQADDPAYVFFTSGSTGVPRAVLGVHKGLSHFLLWQKRRFHIGSGDRCAQLTALSFDVVLRDIFLPLVSGATLCLPSPEDVARGDRILRWMDVEGITVFHTVPTLAQSWLDQFSPEVRLERLRYLFFAGEPLPDDLVRRWRQAFPKAGGIVNLYGPTETTLAKCFHVVPEEPTPGIQPVGRSLPACQALVLNPRGGLCGVGESGEIVLRTPFATRGYINQSGDARQRFVPNPFHEKPGDMLYYSGDRGRYAPNGVLRIEGRLDFQIKVRGIRVEPEEVSSVLCLHPGVNAAVVVGARDDQGMTTLIAYVISNPKVSTSRSDLFSFLRERIPSSIVPSNLVFVDEFPRTASGKIDRRALPGAEKTDREEDNFVAPKTPLEILLADVWCEILSVEQVNVHDNFFDIGGNSLSAMQVILKFEENSARSLDPINFYRQTLGQLAASVDEDERRGEQPSKQQDSEKLEPFYFGKGQQRLFGLYRICRSPRRCGVVFCYPHAHEYVRCHRTFRVLASRFAQAGIHCLSFDYYGTGDSAGAYEEGRIDTWKENVADALDEIRSRFDLERVSLVGLRLGASLALKVAVERSDITAVVLWDPIISGADIGEELGFIRSIQALNPLQREAVEKSDILSYPLTLEMERDLRQLDLFDLQVPSQASFQVIETGNDGNGHRFARHLQAMGAHVDYHDVDEPRIWLREPYQGVVPRLAMETIFSWMLEQCP